MHMKRKRDQGVELFDLATDPSENRNVAAEHPEVVARLRKRLRNWVAELPTQYEKSAKK